MQLKFVEDYKAGDRFELGEFEITHEEVVEFAQKYDPFPFHVDHEAAKATVFGGIISSGWLTALVWPDLCTATFCV